MSGVRRVNRSRKDDTDTMKRATSTLILGLLIAWAAGPLQAADQDQPPAFKGQVEVNDVLLDAVVTDNRGNVVLGLGKDDFKVEENGEPVDLNNVTFYSNRRFVESAEHAKQLGISPEDVPTDRYFILFFHNQRAILPRITAKLLDAGRRAKQWVRTDLSPNDHVAVVGYEYKLEIYQDFTTDSKAIDSAIDDAVRGVEPERWPSRTSPTQGPSLIANLPSPDEISHGSERIYGAMELLAKAAGAIPVRKNLVFFSLGFGELRDFGYYAPDSRYYRPMVETLNDNNVAVYSIDLISVEPGQELRDNIYGNSLSLLSSDTGGHYYFNFVNFLTPLEQVSDQTSGYYLLSYTSHHPAGTSGYQKVTVRTVNPEFRVQAREGYQYGE